MENLIVYSGSESQPEELMMKLFEETLVSHSFETNILCVNVGYTEEGKLFNVVIGEKKSKDMVF